MQRADVVVVVGLLVFLVGLATWGWTAPAEPSRLPDLPPAPSVSAKAPESKALTTSWEGPWSRPPVAVAPPRKVAEPAPVVAAPPPKPDTSTLRLVGSMTGSGEGKTYLFKNTELGTVFTLSLDAATGPWQLKAVEDHRFVIEGPGGVYEVAR